MKINHVISSIDRNAGGTSTCLATLCNALAEYTEININSLASADPLILDDRVRCSFFEPKWSLMPIVCSSALADKLNSVAADVFHAHGLWEMPTRYAIATANKRNIPIIVSPHGMLEPGALQFSRWKKRLAGWTWQNRDLDKANCIHVTSQMEAQNCRKYGLKNPVAIIPNGINLAEFPLKRSLITKWHNGSLKEHVLTRIKPTIKQKRTLLFLSRIHPIKGLINLLTAWMQLEQFHAEWQLVIAGNDDGEHETELKLLASKLNLRWSEGGGPKTDCTNFELRTKNREVRAEGQGAVVVFEGPLFGDAKLKAYQEADLFVLPTFSENFGVVVLEALACGTPVITTKGAPWQELTETEAGWWIDIGSQPLRECLQEALAKSTVELNEMGLRGRKLIEDNYSMDSVAKQMMQVYEWCVSKKNPPGCMRFY
jgi:glycosyltransferase involved in cell wall biosynthesis